MTNLNVTIEMVNGDEYLIKKECFDPNEYIKQMKEKLKENEAIEIYSEYEFCCNDTVGYRTIKPTIEEPLLINASNIVTIEFEKEQIKEKIKLTKFERDILKHCLYKNRNYIARDYNDNLFVYEHAPKKDGKTWENLIDSDNLNLCEDMFLCVSWNDNEPKSIAELLKNCEKDYGVEEHDSK